jgi:DNA polymerase elongation subunit (family B)
MEKNILFTNQIVNYRYLNNNTIQFLDTSGNIFSKKISELGYPYIYGIPDNSKRFSDEELSHIIKTYKMNIPYITHNGIQEKIGYKLEVDEPRHIPSLRDKFTHTFEAKIPYIRRLGFDNKIIWANNVPRYADIDIEERKGDVELIGYKDNITNEYEPYYSVKDFIQTLEKRKILEIYAWNGQAYDFDRLADLTDSLYFKNILKLDAMFMYSIYQQKPPRTLNLAGKETEIGTKVIITKAFSQLTRKELETYNEQDVNIQAGVLNKLGIRDLIHYYSNYLALHPNDIFSNESKYNFQLRPSATRAFDSLIIRKYSPRVYLLDSYTVGQKVSYEGGFVLEPEKGIYYNIASFDYNSLYPHVIMYTDFDNFVYKMVKQFEKDIYNNRLDFKKQYKITNNRMYDTGQQALKILINSLYGIFANPYFRYFNSPTAEHITAQARYQVKKLIQLIQSLGYKIVYADTDSCFVYNIIKSDAEKLADILNKELNPFEVKLEKFYPKALFFGE